MITVENEFLRIAVKQKGSELSSLYNKETNKELLWQGDASFWGGQAPILFPIVGTLKDNKFVHNGSTYELPRHGLVRKSDNWTIEKINETSIKGTFISDADTLKVYPFSFKLEITYSLNGKELEIQHKVVNLDSQEIPFSIGGHPAFNCEVNSTVSYSDYYLEFEEIENSKRHFLNEKGIFNGETSLVLENTNKFPLTTTSFDKDALVFKDLKSKGITLVGPEGKILKVSYPEFNTIGIWATPKAPFICIEPWIGYSDSTESTYNLFDKKDSAVVMPNNTFEAAYQIEVL